MDRVAHPELVPSADPAPPPDRLSRRVVAVVGATATGKSDLAIALAQSLADRGRAAEIVNADSMQLYRGMDIGTAKLTRDEQLGIPHHLLDIWPVTHPASVAEYQQRARAVIDGLLAADRVPIVAGGSGLYVRAALDRLEFPGTDDAVRAELEARLVAEGPESLHAELAGRDPAAAAAILPTNGRRIVRALEVIRLTGAPFTASLPGFESIYDVVLLGLDGPDDWLDVRVDARVERMFAAGLVDEVKALIGVGLRDGRTASRALGYQQVLAHLDGALTLEEARLETARSTRRFVRRQRSWFRRDPRIHWLSRGPDLLDRALQLCVANSTVT
ncbi:MAG TPA: tRNA (adenosine(37)-N6)-dimethylallyltransferase MiaA [Mycobacteriales bacterium]|nr:tRNA (adenosine(37)-N6)-dimethylallyltransferase MiaA [Mycobacteriales bacterium]